MTSGYLRRISRIFRVAASPSCSEASSASSANPEIALFECRKKLAAEPRARKTPATARKTIPIADHEGAVGQRETQRGMIKPVQPADDDRLGFLHVLRAAARTPAPA